MKTTVLLGMMSLLLTIVYNNKVGGAPRVAALSPDRPVTVPAQSDLGDSSLSERLSEYLFLHQTRYENLPVNAMAGVKACPE